MICPKCNLANSDDAKICSHCGASLGASAGNPPLSAAASAAGGGAGATATAAAAAGATAAAGSAAGARGATWAKGATPLAGFIERMKNILLNPKGEWPVIERESTSIAQLYTGYVLPLTAFAAVMSFVRMSIIGASMPFGGTFRISIYDGLTMMVVRLIASLIGVLLIGLIINGLAPTFAGQRDNRQALKTAAYAFTPAWLASVFLLLGGLGALLQLLAAIYGIYLLYLGLPVLMKCAREKAVGYTATVVICTIVLAVVFGVLNRATGGFGGYASFSAASMQSAQQRRAAAALRNAVGDALGTDQKSKEHLSAAVDRLAEIRRQLQEQAKQQQGQQTQPGAEPVTAAPAAMPAAATEATQPQAN